MVIMAVVAILLGMGTKTSSVSERPLAPVVSEPRPRNAPSAQTSQPSRGEIKEFFLTHPQKGVRDDFHHLLISGQMSFVWNAVGTPVATFGLIQDGDSEPVLALLADPEIFLERNRSLAQITIYHEYLHYLQWRDGTIPESAFYIRDSMPHDEVHDWCKQKWHAERLAYHEACAFGREAGLIGDLRPGGPLSVVCTADEPQFIPILKRVLTLADPSGPMCSQTWNTI
ncbi:hypothetical protein HY626_01710 [Candidatus Uhrbacteria bacterium]|nr:hypothetical protein [Candidatus Uhrbacteria bacterium]